jgi:signal transduction histidine kinase
MSRAVRMWVEGEPGALAWSDPRRLRQIVTNLVSNALKATAEGEIRLSVTKAEGAVVLEVSDTGRGIEPAVLSTIFEPYKQAGDASARRGGAGLGLAITRRLVLLHGGSINAWSELGRGSRFTVKLPDDSHSKSVPRDSLVPFGPPETFTDSGRIITPPSSGERSP